MKRTALLALGFAALSLSACAVFQQHPVGNRAVPQPARTVDLDRYLGKWYEIARYEQGFQRGCQAVTAEYSRLPDGKIRVLNTCRKPDGRVSRADGKAKVADVTTNAKLKVSFFGPFYIGDYWVLDHADDYSWSVVGDPSGRYLWLLHRQAVPGRAIVDGLVRRAAQLGYDTRPLIRTIQP